MAKTASRASRHLDPGGPLCRDESRAVVGLDRDPLTAPIRLAVYNDRIEIESPGLLPFGLTLDDIRQGVSKLRNRVIGRVFHELRLIEQWGSGIQRMTAVCSEAGLAPRSLEELATNFRVSIFTARVKAAATAHDRRRQYTIAV